MKACWDNIECLKYRKKAGVLWNPQNNIVWHIKEACKVCGEPFLGASSNPIYCSTVCKGRDQEELLVGENNPFYGKKHSKETIAKTIQRNRLRVCSNESKKRMSDAKKGSKNSFYGKTHSDETKAKISHGNKGKRWSEEAKKKMSEYRKGKNVGKENPMYGKVASEETKQKMREAKKGMKRSAADRKKRCGSGNPNWRGGLSKLPYCPVWTDTFKKEVKERDNYQCQNPFCESPDAILAVHHIDYNKKNCDPENLITLCHIDNSRANFDRQWHQAFYMAIMEKNKQQRRLSACA